METVILGLGVKQPDLHDEEYDENDEEENKGEEEEETNDLCSAASLLLNPSPSNGNNISTKTTTTTVNSSTSTSSSLLDRIRRKISLAYLNHEIHYPVYTGSTREKVAAEFTVFLIWFGLSLPSLAYVAWVAWVNWHRWAWTLRMIGSVGALPALARGSPLVAATVGGDGGNESARVGAAIMKFCSTIWSSVGFPGVS